MRLRDSKVLPTFEKLREKQKLVKTQQQSSKCSLSSQKYVSKTKLKHFFINSASSNFTTKMSFPIETLPDETLLNLFKFLKFKDLGRCLQVSKRLRKMALEETLWEKVKIVDQGNLLWGIDKKTVREGISIFIFYNFIYRTRAIIRRS